MVFFEDKELSEVPVVVVDTETTGLFPGMGHRVVEVGAVRLEGWREVGQVSGLVNPGRSMEPSAAKVNGISEEELLTAPPFADIAPRLHQLLAGAVLVAHNAQFDAGFLGMEYAILGQNGFTLFEPVLPNPWLCTMLLARRQFYFGQNNLGHVARQLGVRTGRAHRALNDVYMTIEVLKRMVQQLANRKLRTIGDLFVAQGGPIFAPTFSNIALPPLVQEAISGRSPLQIGYQGPGGESKRKITPLYPTQHEGVAYLVAYCHLRHEQRTFRLDRITAITTG